MKPVDIVWAYLIIASLSFAGGVVSYKWHIEKPRTCKEWASLYQPYEVCKQDFECKKDVDFYTSYYRIKNNATEACK